MADFYTADLHFGHANIIRYCKRPYASVAEMDADLVVRWNTVVSEADRVWVLGDVAMGNIEGSLLRVNELNGQKLLVMGNHDRPFYRESRRFLEWEPRYRDAGFAEMFWGAIDHTVADEARSQAVQMCHFPFYGDSKDQDRFPDLRPADTGQWLLHGHVHETWRQQGRQINVGVDAWGGAPVSAETLLDLIAEGPEVLSPLPWERLS